MTYEPQVNHYVEWKKGVEGWVYFVDKEYITVECVVRPKDEVNLECCPIHKNERLLVICYPNQWKELKYIKSRQTQQQSFEMSQHIYNDALSKLSPKL